MLTLSKKANPSTEFNIENIASLMFVALCSGHGTGRNLLTIKKVENF